MIFREGLLLDDLPRLRMYLFVLDLADIPTATKSLHQIHGVDHLLPKKLGLKPLAVEERGFGGNHIEVIRNSADVAVVSNLKSFAGVFHGRGLRGQCLGQSAQVTDPVFYFLKRRQYRLPVIGDGLIVGSTGCRQVCAIAATLNDRLQGIRSQRPEKTWRTEQRGDGCALQSSTAA